MCVLNKALFPLLVGMVLAISSLPINAEDIGMVNAEKLLYRYDNNNFTAYVCEDYTSTDYLGSTDPYDIKGPCVVPECVSVNNIPYTVIGVSKYSFKECSEMTSITFPITLLFIGNGAFEFCNSLTEISIPLFVTEIGEYAFRKCGSLQYFDVDLNNKFYSSVDGVLCTKDSTTLIKFPEGYLSKSYRIPECVSQLERLAFESCRNLQSITFTGGIKEIPWGTFQYCYELRDIDFGDSIIEIEDECFLNCINLKTLNLPNSMIYISANAFSGCTSLEYLSLGNSLQSIRHEAFSGCDNLKTIISHAVIPPNCHDDTWSKNNFTDATLYVPTGTSEAYREAKGWKNFQNIVEGVEAGVEGWYIDEMADGLITVYDMNGRRLYISSNDELRSLDRGLYIVNGKKVLLNN